MPEPDQAEPLARWHHPFPFREQSARILPVNSPPFDTLEIGSQCGTTNSHHRGGFFHYPQLSQAFVISTGAAKPRSGEICFSPGRNSNRWTYLRVTPMDGHI
jgi:hypothetical protein